MGAFVAAADLPVVDLGDVRLPGLALHHPAPDGLQWPIQKDRYIPRAGPPWRFGAPLAGSGVVAQDTSSICALTASQYSAWVYVWPQVRHS